MRQYSPPPPRDNLRLSLVWDEFGQTVRGSGGGVKGVSTVHGLAVSESTFHGLGERGRLAVHGRKMDGSAVHA